MDRIAAVTRRLWADGDPVLALANASAYLEAVGHVVIAWMWLEQVLALPPEGAGDAFHAGKRQAARYFFTVELPRTGPQFDLLDEPGPDHAGHARGLVLTAPPPSPSAGLVAHRLPSLDDAPDDHDHQRDHTDDDQPADRLEDQPEQDQHAGDHADNPEQCTHVHLP